MQEIKRFNLLVNDKAVPCKDFVQDIIGKALLGMVDSLHLKEDSIKKISLEIAYFD